MKHTLSEIATALGLRLEGDGGMALTGLRHPAQAGPEDLALAMDAAHAAALVQGSARAALLAEGADWRALGLEGAVFAQRPRYALAGLTQRFDPAPRGVLGTHPTALVAEGARIGGDVSIGPFCVIDDGAEIGDGCALGPHVHVAAGARIGGGSTLGAGVRIGWGVTVGARAIIHANAVIGADGFSFVTPQRGAVESAKQTGAVTDDARNTFFARIHSLGAVTIGDDVEIGAGTTIDRGTVADTTIGDGTKIDNQVQIGHNVRVGRNCLLCAQVGIAGSSTIGDRVVLGGQAGVGDHLTIGDDVIAGGASGIGTDIKARSVVLGAPAMPRDEALAIFLAWRRLPRMVATVRELKKRLSVGEPNG
jgi:UDP-3-O-[3-hydroxymyristoyl] glucosamine N-acyltransferase